MIIYRNSSMDFDLDVRYNKIVDVLEREFTKITGHRVGDAEKRSWRNSLGKINDVLINEKLNLKDCGVLIEYQLPQSSMRLDFMITGKDKFRNENAVIVELKQWDKVVSTDTEHQVVTYVGNAYREVNHPSVQVTQYKQYLQDYHSAFNPDNDKPINLYSCSYLHNFPLKDAEVLKEDKFRDYIKESPIYTEQETKQIGLFIRNHVELGDGLEILDYIGEGIPKPSKKLINYINGILDSKDEFILLGNQMIVFDRVMQFVKDKKLDGSDGKYVVLVKGGPGTGKSVVGLNLLAKTLNEDKDCIYLAANAAFKNGMANQLDKVRSNKLFKHPYFYNKELTLESKSFQVAIVDEAHRISETPPPMQMKLDKSLIQLIIEKTHLSVFFSDDNQMIRPKDIGTYEHIKQVANNMKCEVFEYELDAQFRCAGSDGYINWLNDVLSIKRTANASGWENMDEMKFEIFDSPQEMFDKLKRLQLDGNTSRLVAGYAWPWSKELDSSGNLKDDVIIKNHKDDSLFKMPWNPQESYKTKKEKGIPKNGADWAVNPLGINQIGCIHTCQGLEFDYVGVIIGEDFVYRFKEDKWIANPNKSFDTKINSNYKDYLRLAQNTYRTLLTRGVKGVFVYSVDKETQDYLKQRLNIVKMFENKRLYHKKENTFNLMFESKRSIMVSEANVSMFYELKTIKLRNYSLIPIEDSYYICDIKNGSIFFDELIEVSNFLDLEHDLNLRSILESRVDIINYSLGKKDLLIDLGLLKVIPLYFAKRLSGNNEIYSIVFKKQ